MKNHIYFFFLLCAFFQTKGQAPAKPYQIQIIAQANTNSGIDLRWAPMNIETWEWGNLHGYKLERLTVKINGVDQTQDEQIQSYVELASPILPLPLADWEPLVANDDLAGIAAGALYSDQFEILDLSTADLTDIVNLNKDKENRFGFGLFAADQSFSVAQNMGLGFIDNSAQVGYEYLYGITMLGPLNTNNLEPGLVQCSLDDLPSLTAPSITEVIGGDLVAEIRWEAPENADQYLGYIIERLYAGSGGYQPINTVPIINPSVNSAETSESYVFMDELTLG
ncbi:MAG: hypothetical protein AAFU64_17705, partial [Bacteroidota bacterium]